MSIMQRVKQVLEWTVYIGISFSALVVLGVAGVSIYVHIARIM